MAKLTTLQKLDSAIRAGAKEAEPKASNRQLGEQFCEAEPGLIEPFLKEWAIEKVAGLFGKYRAKARRDNDEQLQFETILELRFPKSLRRITLKSGETKSRYDANLTELRQQRALLYKEGNTGLPPLDAAIERMEKYASSEPGITYGEVLKREAEKEGK
jgi:hypothetical protein